MQLQPLWGATTPKVYIENQHGEDMAHLMLLYEAALHKKKICKICCICATL